MALRAPLRWIAGTYPAVALSLPTLSTPAQKQRQLLGDESAMGVTLDFVLDTAANTNTISAEVAGPTSQGGLELTPVGSIPSGVGAGGSIGGGVTYALGTAELGDVPKSERVPFISGLTAAALPIAAPSAAGLLGVSFLNRYFLPSNRRRIPPSDSSFLLTFLAFGTCLQLSWRRRVLLGRQGRRGGGS